MAKNSNSAAGSASVKLQTNASTVVLDNVMTAFDANAKWWRIETVCLATAVPRSTIYRYVTQGRFPQPVRITPRISAWSALEVRAWLQARLDERDAAIRLKAS